MGKQEYSLLPEHHPASPPSEQAGMQSSKISARQMSRLVLMVAVSSLFIGFIGLSTGQLQVSSLSTALANFSASRYTPLVLPAANNTILPHDFTTWPSPTPELPMDATLDQRLAEWQKMPISTAANWARFNAKTCPPSKTDVNKLWGFVTPIEQVNGPWANNFWKDPVAIAKIRQEVALFLTAQRDAGFFNATYQGEGRGIIFSAGNSDTFDRVLTTLKLLRNHFNTSLPAEIFSFPGENPPKALLPEFEKYNAKLRQLPSISKDPTRKKNWHIKAAALLECSFREVLYLDSDNMPAASLEGPESIFDSPGFKRLGVMFWPDYWKTVAHNPVWQVIGVQCREEWEQEAGQILIDKARHLDALHLTNYMLLRYKTWFTLSDGDKDLFRFAMLALRKRWAVPGAFVGSASWPKERPSDFCSHTMLQYDHLGKPLFVHANMLKKLPWTLPFKSDDPKKGVWGVTKRANLSTPEDDLDCDHLANPDLQGNAIKQPPSQAARRRVALEKGIRTWFRSTREYSSCLDQRWDDPRTQDDKLIDKYVYQMGPLAADRMKWKSPMVEDLWSDDERLKGFEAAFWDSGGRTGGKNFG